MSRPQTSSKNQSHSPSLPSWFPSTNKKHVHSPIMAHSLTPQPQLLLSSPPLHSPSPPPSRASPPLDTTITDRIFMDISLCPTTFLPNTNPTLSPDPSTHFCTESFLLGHLILGLYGHLVPLTVSNSVYVFLHFLFLIQEHPSPEKLSTNMA